MLAGSVPTFLLHEFIDLLLPSVTVSLAQGRLPLLQRHAIVTLLIKKPGQDGSDMSNYRPVSNLSFMSKIVKRVVAEQLNVYAYQQSDATWTIQLSEETFNRNSFVARVVWYVECCRYLTRSSTEAVGARLQVGWYFAAVDPFILVWSYTASCLQSTTTCCVSCIGWLSVNESSTRLHA